MECFINGKQADITEYQADELVQALLISLFLGVAAMMTMALKFLGGRVGGETHSPMKQMTESAPGYGCCSGKNSLMRWLPEHVSMRKSRCNGCSPTH